MVLVIRKLEGFYVLQYDLLLRYFMSQIATGVIIAVLGAVVIHWLGLDGAKVVVIHGRRQTKKWKVLIVLSWIAIAIGAYLTITYAPQGGLSNPYTGYGINFMGYGFIALQLVRFGAWWNRD